MSKKHLHYEEADRVAIVEAARGSNIELRQDAGLHLAQQLDYVKSQAYQRKMPTLRGLELVPVDTEIPEWAETITYRSFDVVGMAKVVANYADDLPRADVKGTETTVRIRDIGDSYGYNIREMIQSEALGSQLIPKKAYAARRAIELKLNSIALEGDVEFGLYGFTNHPNISTANPTNGNWTAQGTTAEQIIADVRQLYNAIQTQSKGVHVANRLAVPLSVLAAMQEKLVTDGSESAFDRVRKNYPELEIMGLPELDGSAGSMMGFIGEFDADNASIAIPMPFNQLAAQARNLELVVPCLARTGGVVVEYPLAFAKVTNL